MDFATMRQSTKASWHNILREVWVVLKSEAAVDWATNDRDRGVSDYQTLTGGQNDFVFQTQTQVWLFAKRSQNLWVVLRLFS